MNYTSNSEEQTIEIAKDIATKLYGGNVVLLSGDLGAGKTTFTKGIGKYFGIQEHMTSPTFSLMNVYELKDTKNKINKLIHIDTYRMKNEQELLEIGIEDYLANPDTLCIIEWPEKISTLLKNYKKINISIEHNSKNSRKIFITKKDI